MTPAEGHFWSALEWQQPSPRWSGPGCSTPPCSSQRCSCTWCCPCAAARQAPCDAKHSNCHYGHRDHHNHLEDVPDLLVGHLEDLHSCADCGKFFTIVPGVQRLLVGQQTIPGVLMHECCAHWCTHECCTHWCTHEWHWSLKNEPPLTDGRSSAGEIAIVSGFPQLQLFTLVLKLGSSGKWWGWWLWWWWRWWCLQKNLWESSQHAIEDVVVALLWVLTNDSHLHKNLWWYLRWNA